MACDETLLDACRPLHPGQHLDPARSGDHARVEGGVVGDVGSVCVHVRSRGCWSGFSRELLPRLLPLRRQGKFGRGWCRFAAMPTEPLPTPPLLSQGRGRKLAVEPAPKWQSVAAYFVVQALVESFPLTLVAGLLSTPRGNLFCGARAPFPRLEV